MGEFEALASSLLVVVAGIVALSLLALGGLGLRRRHGGLDALGTHGSYLLLVGPVAIPFLWTVGATFHELEPGNCLGHPGHFPGDLRVHVAILVLSAGIPLAAALGHHLARSWREGGGRRPAPADHPACVRLRAITRSRPELADLHLRVLDDGAPILRTQGLFRPFVEIDASLALAMQEPPLTAALYHEREHVIGMDPLRRLLLATALTLNPLARGFRRHADLWRFGRELTCDRNAVASGADALNLAEALVLVARPGAETLAPCLSRGAMDRLRLRVRRLLDYVHRPPARPSTRGSVLLPLTLAILLLTAPHAVDAWPFVDIYEDFHGVPPTAGIVP
jgi:hypothetical protein